MGNGTLRLIPRAIKRLSRDERIRLSQEAAKISTERYVGLFATRRPCQDFSSSSSSSSSSHHHHHHPAQTLLTLTIMSVILSPVGDFCIDSAVHPDDPTPPIEDGILVSQVESTEPSILTLLGDPGQSEMSIFKRICVLTNLADGSFSVSLIICSTHPPKTILPSRKPSRTPRPKVKSSLQAPHTTNRLTRQNFSSSSRRSSTRMRGRRDTRSCRSESGGHPCLLGKITMID